MHSRPRPCPGCRPRCSRRPHRRASRPRTLTKFFVMGVVGPPTSPFQYQIPPGLPPAVVADNPHVVRAGAVDPRNGLRVGQRGVRPCDRRRVGLGVGSLLDTTYGVRCRALMATCASSPTRRSARSGVADLDAGRVKRRRGVGCALELVAVGEPWSGSGGIHLVPAKACRSG